MVGFPIMNALFIHRMVIIPGVVTGYYYDFFSHHPFEMLAHSILKPFLSSPYREAPAFVIGRYYWSSAKMDANANLWASAYSDFGFLGMLFFSALLGIVLNLYDKLSENLDLRFACMVIAFPTMILANASLLTSLLTGGIGLLIITLLFVPRDVVGASSVNVPARMTAAS